MPKGSQNLVNKYAEQRGTIKKIKRKENYKQNKMKSPTKTTIKEKLKLESEQKKMPTNNHELFKANRGSHNNTIW